MASRVRGGLLAMMGAALGVLLALFLVVGAVGGWLSFGRTETIDRSQPPLLLSLQDLSKYKAASANLQVVVDIEEDVERVPDFLAGRRTLVVAAGSVDAEIDFSGLDEGAVVTSEDRTMARIYLPHATLTDARIDNERTYIAAQERGLLDRLNDAIDDAPAQDAQELYIYAEDKIEDAAVETDLVERAEANTRNMLTGMLSALGYTDVEIEFTDEAPG